MKSKSKTDEPLAERWACTTRTIRNWRKAGAPLSSEAKMLVWLASQRSIPERTQAILDSHRAEAVSRQALKPQLLPTGAAQALKRLEEMEARYFTGLCAAHESGDPVEIKRSHELWRTTSEQLRKTDLVIEQDRRQSGELIAKKDVEVLLREFGKTFYFLAQQTSQIPDKFVGLTDSVQASLAIQALINGLSSSVMADLRSWNARAKSTVPKYHEWMLDAISMGLSCANKETDFWWPERKAWELETSKLLVELIAQAIDSNK